MKSAVVAKKIAPVSGSFWSILKLLRANVCNFPKSGVSHKILDFFIFCPNNLYSEVFSKITLKIVTTFYFFIKRAKIEKWQISGFSVVKLTKKLNIFISLVHKNTVSCINKMWPQNKQALVRHNTVTYFGLAVETRIFRLLKRNIVSAILKIRKLDPILTP